MINDLLMRRILWAAAAYNFGGGAILAFPESALGQLAGLPAAPAGYKALAAMFVLLFGAMYAWLAWQQSILRQMVVLGAIGKSAAFASIFALWLVSDVPFRNVVAISGDLIFAVLFILWATNARGVR